MKRLFFMGLALAVAGLTSCLKNSDNITGSSNNGQSSKFTIVCNAPGTTKISVAPAGNEGDECAVVWEAGDQIQLVSRAIGDTNDPFGAISPITTTGANDFFSIDAGAGTNSATFSGTLSYPDAEDTGREYYAYYPQDAATGTGATAARPNIDMAGSTTISNSGGPQIYTGNAAGMGKYLKMYAYAELAPGEAPSSSNLVFNFHQMTCILDFNIKNLPADRFVQSVSITGTEGADKSANAAFLVRGIMNYADIKSGKTAMSAPSAGQFASTFTVNCVPALAGQGTDNHCTASLVIFPRDNKDGNYSATGFNAVDTRNFQIDVTTTSDADGLNDPQVATFYKLGVPTGTWKEGFRYPTTLDFTAFSQEATPAISANTIEITSRANLNWLVNHINDKYDGTNTYNDPAWTIKVMNDFNMGVAPFTPPGTTAAPLLCNVDGGGNTITGLGVIGTDSYPSLLGNCAGTSTTHQNIHDLNLATVRIDATLSAAYTTASTGIFATTGVVVGSGAIVGAGKYVDISNCKVTGISLSVTSPSPANIYTMTNGGIIGYADHCKITSCKIIGGSLTSTGTTGPAGLGGICGYMTESSIVNCSNSATVAYIPSSANSSGSSALGGIVAGIDGVPNPCSSLVMGCKNSGVVSMASAPNNSNWRVGGIVGTNGVNSNNGGAGGGRGALIVGCYNTGTITNNGPTGTATNTGSGGIAGRNAGTISACFSTGAITTTATATTTVLGFIVGTNNGTSPIEACYYSKTGSAATAAIGSGNGTASDFATSPAPDDTMVGWGSTAPTVWANVSGGATWATPWVSVNGANSKLSDFVEAAN